MTDTTTITPEEKAEWLKEAQPKSVSHYEPIDFEMDKRIRRLLTALDAAEAERGMLQQRVNELLSEELTAGAVRQRIQLRFNMHEVLQENEQWRAEREWLAENVEGRPCDYDSCPFGLPRPTGPDYGCGKTHVQCWQKALTRAVADAESEVE